MQRPCSNQRVMQRKSLAHNGAGARPAPLLVRLLFLRAAADPHVRCRAMPLAREPVISPPVRDCVYARVCAACGRRLAPSVSQRLEPDAVVAVHHNWIKGDRHKWTRAVETSAVAVNNTPGFLDRARSSMKAGVYWSVYEPSTPRSCDLAPRSPPVFRGVCQSAPPPRLCLTRSPVALWSFPGTGNTWLRLAIELATGIVSDPLSNPHTWRTC